MSRIVRNLSAALFLFTLVILPTRSAALDDSCAQQQYLCDGDSVAFQNCQHSCDYLEERCVRYCMPEYDQFTCDDSSGTATGRCDCEPACMM